jgi:hypothetical protein
LNPDFALAKFAHRAAASPKFPNTTKARNAGGGVNPDFAWTKKSRLFPQAMGSVAKSGLNYPK